MLQKVVYRETFRAPTEQKTGGWLEFGYIIGIFLRNIHTNDKDEFLVLYVIKEIIHLGL